MPNSNETKKLFLEGLKTGFSITKAADAVGLGREEVIALREQDPAFAAAWADAVESAIDTLEDVAVERALADNDKLLELLLKAKRPEIFARPEATTNQTVNVVMPTLAELDKKYKEYGLDAAGV